MSEAKFDPRRRLCPDGACIGVIGDDGRCRVCGRSASGAPAEAGFMASQPEDAYEDAYDDDGDSDGDDDAAGAERAPGEAGAARAAGGAGFDPNRRLCPDGGCLGVLGADGVCNVCGQKVE